MVSSRLLPIFVVSLLSLTTPLTVLAAPGDFGEDEVEVRWSRSGDDGSYYGWALADVRDVNRDGIAELAVGAPNALGAEGPAGLLELLSGVDGAPLWSVDGLGSEQLGYAMADAGDVDGDGHVDVIVGAPGAEGGGRVVVLSGVDGALIHDIASPTPGAAFGSAVAGGGRLDDDTFADLIVGGELAGEGGAIWAFAGADGALLWSVEGEAGDKLGSATAYVGDHDDDGFDDPFVGARDGGGGRGYARVLSGIDGATLLELAPDEQGGDFGWFFVAGVGDLDGDARSDLYVGDFASSAGGSASGRIHAYSSADGSPLLTILGTGPGEGLGPGRGAGDVDFDGVPDLLVGAYSSSAGAPGAGRSFVFSGASGEVLRTITSMEAGEQFGFDAIGLGDHDDDGDPELAVSAAAGDHVYVIAGLGGMGGEEDGEETETGGEGEGAEAPESESDDGEPGGESETGSGPGADEPNSGCACDLRGSSPSGAALLLVVVFGLRRRA